MLRSVGSRRSAIGAALLALALAGCGGSSAGGSPAGAGSTAATSPMQAAATAGGGDTSSSSVKNVCNAISLADVGTAFGGTWHVMTDYASGTPLVCGLSDGPHGMSVELKPNGYATSGMSMGNAVAGVGEETTILANTMWIRRGADVIVVIWLSNMSPTITASLATFGKLLYPKF
jgi:hypothetical protein